jgi:hypothetical protein
MHKRHIEIENGAVCHIPIRKGMQFRMSIVVGTFCTIKHTLRVSSGEQLLQQQQQPKKHHCVDVVFRCGERYEDIIVLV